MPSRHVDHGSLDSENHGQGSQDEGASPPVLRYKVCMSPLAFPSYICISECVDMVIEMKEMFEMNGEDVEMRGICPTPHPAFEPIQVTQA